MVKFFIYTLLSFTLINNKLINGQLYGCENKPCQNGGTCLDQPNTLYGFSCICPTQFYGTNCQISTMPGNNPIIGGGSIDINNGDIKPKPNQNINPVLPPGGGINIGNNGFEIKSQNNQCLNGGTFIQSGLPCKCPIGYSGARCEYVPNNFGYCQSNPCFNGGVCYSNTFGFTCQCNGAYYGKRCEYIRAASRPSSGKILGISFGSILPTLLFIGLIFFCIYYCVIKKRNTNNSASFMGGNAGMPYPNTFRPPPQQPAGFYNGYPLQQQHPFMQSQARPQSNTTQPHLIPDPDEVFKVNQSPPSYEEVQNRKV